MLEEKPASVVMARGPVGRKIMASFMVWERIREVRHFQ
jgi:hypothetical protein